MHRRSELRIQTQIFVLLHVSHLNDNARDAQSFHPRHYPVIREILPAGGEHAPKLQEGSRVIHESVERLYSRQVPVHQN